MLSIHRKFFQHLSPTVNSSSFLTSCRSSSRLSVYWFFSDYRSSNSSITIFSGRFLSSSSSVASFLLRFCNFSSWTTGISSFRFKINIKNFKCYRFDFQFNVDLSPTCTSFSRCLRYGRLSIAAVTVIVFCSDKKTINI